MSDPSDDVVIRNAMIESAGDPMERVTRFEVIDDTGRPYVKRDVKIELSLQDEGRTLKVFVKAREAQPAKPEDDDEEPDYIPGGPLAHMGTMMPNWAKMRKKKMI
jgi:hypothetical protein